MTEEEITKLVIFLIQYTPKLIDSSQNYKELSKEYDTFPKETLEIFKNNSEYYIEQYNILTKLLEKLDNIPF